MEPGSETFLGARYIVRFFDAADPEYQVLYFQTASPFPRYEAGDRMNTIPWPLNQQGREAVVESVQHVCHCPAEQVYFEQNVVCRFAHSTLRVPGDLEP